MIRTIFNWIFAKELSELNDQLKKTQEIQSKITRQGDILNNVLSNIDISVDVHQHHNYSKSWAVISLQGSKTDYIKFVDLADNDIQYIKQLLKQFERNGNIKVDASPRASEFLRIPKTSNHGRY